MAKLADIGINTRNPANQKFVTFRFKCSVESNGMFKATIPEEHVKAAEVFHDANQGKEFYPEIGFSKFKLRGKSRGCMHEYETCFTGDSLDKLRQYLRDFCEDLMACETIKENFLIVAYGSNMSYVVKDDGTLAPTSRDDLTGEWDHDREDHHHEDQISSWEDPDRYSVGFGAQVYVKTTFKRKSGDEICWDPMEFNEETVPVTTYAQRLNSFRRISYDDSDLKRIDARETDKDTIHILPYTEEGARFFYEMMLALCGLDLKLREMFKSAETITRMIQSFKPGLPQIAAPVIGARELQRQVELRPEPKNNGETKMKLKLRKK